ncbi:hypothetical protein QJQ45_004624 [Haematococcus lacustris]|nr:hypothetical protein QJQ45_004624 [Haematococcus lacustris]
MQRIGESRWRPLELCYWPEQGKLPAKGKEYPGDHDHVHAMCVPCVCHV